VSVAYTVRWDTAALEDLEELGSAESVRIVRKVESHLAKDPLGLGEPLRENLKGFYRYRIGDYRVIYQVVKHELIITVVRVGHRKNVYEQ